MEAASFGRMKPDEYTFPTELKNLREYYRKAGDSLTVDSSESATIGSEMVTGSFAPDRPELYTYLQKSIPIMLCMAWEVFVMEMKRPDRPRYEKCFGRRTNPHFERRYNSAISEIFLIRNSIVHCNGYPSEEYLKTFTGRFAKGQRIVIDDIEIEREFKIFLDAYERIVKNQLTALP